MDDQKSSIERRYGKYGSGIAQESWLDGLMRRLFRVPLPDEPTIENPLSQADLVAPQTENVLVFVDRTGAELEVKGVRIRRVSGVVARPEEDVIAAEFTEA
jgi:hypothetical protein